MEEAGRDAGKEIGREDGRDMKGMRDGGRMQKKKKKG